MRLIVLAILVGLLAACERDKGAQVQTQAVTSEHAAIAGMMRNHDSAQLAQGAEIYQRHCAACHGTQGEGAPRWNQRGADGKYPAPPLNGTGHSWHHPLTALRLTIRDGTARIGGSMPAWRDKITNKEIDAVIAWFQARWPDEIYRAWLDMDTKAQR